MLAYLRGLYIISTNQFLNRENKGFFLTYEDFSL